MSNLSADALLQAAEAKQRLASDPTVSAWVRANAGTGKTHVLVQRILRLLLAGAEPRSILCLTFTKNAAAEMEERVLGRLGEWATAASDALGPTLERLLGRAASETELDRARCLFAGLTDMPGGFAIMTIHGFCERVLRRYSFEANVPPGFTVLTEEEARDALSEAQAQAFASGRTSAPLADAFTTIVAYAGENDFERVLSVMLGHRAELFSLLRLSDGDPFAGVEARLRRLFDLAREDTRDKLLRRSASLLPERTLAELAALLVEGTKTDKETAARVADIVSAEGIEAKHAAFKALFTTKTGEARKNLATSAIRQQVPVLYERLVKAQTAFLAFDEKICALKVIEATVALVRLAVAIFERYEAEKWVRGAVDFDDLIARTLNLLQREDAADWVLYQLDGRIGHILVDEAQDTSPAQWAIIEALTSEFFSGEGARDATATLFAVGDEKQSIYGFQGAAPELLAQSGAAYEAQAREAGCSWRGVDLDLSFRTLGPVLAAVDRVIETVPSLMRVSSAPHEAYRKESGGLVELWTPEKGEKQHKGSVWEEEAAAAPTVSPPEALAAAIAAKIKHWLDSNAPLASQGRAIEPGDILILLRKRQPMAGLLQAALKREGVAVCGADRVALLDELAIMDLMALSAALLQPEDDLATAEILKSPLFGFLDDDLFSLASDRNFPLSQRLNRFDEDTYRNAADKLARWRDLAHRATPFDFFSHILDAEGGREAFGARLGADCFDALDELLTLAETFGARGLLSLPEFLVSLKRGASEVKRETDQGAGGVRIMTVHAAKGLEANIVILADACGKRSASAPPVYFTKAREGSPPLPIWAIKGASRLPPIASLKDDVKQEEERELDRLLYVAMTRARDRLYVTGQHQGELPARCWYDTVKTALLPVLETAVDFRGAELWRFGKEAQAAFIGARATSKDARRVDDAAPSWLWKRAATEPPLRMISPSRLPIETPMPIAATSAKNGLGRGEARSKGVLIHRLLEVLPPLPASARAAAAKAIASAFAASLSLAERDHAIESALGLLGCEIFTKSGPLALAEAAIAAMIETPSGGRAVVLGQIDRIHLDGAEISIFDYKSGAFADDASHLAQLSAYLHSVKRVYPHIATVHAAVLNTHSKVAIEADALPLDTLLGA